MRKNAVVAIVGTSVVLAVAVTVTLVLTLQEDTPKAQLGSVVAEASQGYLVGNVTPEAGIFWGIPFSQPPVGEYRWKKPRNPVKFPGKYWDATYIRPACIQICHQPAEEYSCPHEEDEDCLYINIWVPKRLLETVSGDDIVAGEHYAIKKEYQNGDENSLAVMLFFYGGNFLNGAGSATLYDGRYLVDQGNVIAVTMNYRVGPLGFLVQGDGEDASLGNYGIWDQIRSLEWVRDNIRWFGGNPNKVTVYGQSAGAESIGVLMTTPYAKGLFHQAIMESNPFGLPFRDSANAREFGSRFAEAAGCLPHDMDCLRKADTDTILTAFKESSLEVVGVDQILLLFQPWSPNIDGDFLLEQPVDAFRKGSALDIPTIIGTTADEGMLFVEMAFPGPINNRKYRGIMRIVMKNETRLVLARYPPQCEISLIGSCDNRYVMNDLATDYLFVCPQRASMFYMGSDTWFYIFNETWSFYELWELPTCFERVCHAAELPYVFNVENLTIHEYTNEERVLSKRMGWYWTNFAKYGNPNGDISKMSAGARLGQITDGDKVGAVYWPRFRETTEAEYTALQFTAEGDFVMNNPYEETCTFWDNLDSYGDHFVLGPLG